MVWHISHSQTVPRVNERLIYAKPYPGYSLAMINVWQTIPKVQFGYVFRTTNLTLGNVNIGMGWLLHRLSAAPYLLRYFTLKM